MSCLFMRSSLAQGKRGVSQQIERFEEPHRSRRMWVASTGLCGNCDELEQACPVEGSEEQSAKKSRSSLR